MEYCKYANSRSWDAVWDDMVWTSHLDLFVNSRRVRIAEHWVAVERTEQLF